MRGFSFFLGTDSAGHTNCVSVFAPDGRLLSLHRLSGVLEPRTRFTLSGRQPFSLNLSGELRSAERGDSPRPAAGQEGRHQGFYPLNSHFLLGESGADCRHVTAAKRGTAEDSSSATDGPTSGPSFSSTYSQCQITYCYTCGFIYAGATYPCCATLWHVVAHGTCGFRRLVQFIFVGAVYYNALTSCATRVCRACVN